MILSLRHIRRRIRSVENTKKMTRAMEMVAASKLKKLQEMLKQSDRYIGEVKRILETLVREKPLAHPLLEQRAEIKHTTAFLIASDTGLCGSYNTNILECANQFLENSLRGPRMTEAIHFIAIGRQAVNYLTRRRQQVLRGFSVPKPQEIDETIQTVAQIATEQFKKGEADQIVFIYTKAASLGSLRPAVARLFPIVSTPLSSPLVGEDQGGGIHPPHPGLLPQRGEGISTEGDIVDYLIEPSLDEVLELLLPEFIEAEVGQWIKHSLVAEQASRMLAMRQATDNAEEMVDSLTLLRNKARQAAITKELIEVVSGSRALQMK